MSSEMQECRQLEARDPLIAWTRPLRRLMAAIAALFALLVALQLHGFSLPMWHDVIDDSPAPEVLLGEPRYLRADDWLAQLPLVFSQARHDPRFPVVNRHIGLGQNALLPITLPVLHPVTLFRPTQWGFFLGEDVGMAWMWWLQVLGVFSVWLGVLLLATRNDLALSVLGSLLLLASPFFQLWGFNKAGLPIYMGLCVLATLGLLGARRRGRILASGALLGWAGGCFLLMLYPPYQVGLAYLYLALVGGLVWQRRCDLALRTRLPARCAGLLLALGIAGFAALWLWLGAADAVEAMRGTVYPGQRISTGGHVPTWQLLATNLWITHQVTDYGSLGIDLDAAFFWFFSPVVACALLWRRISAGERAPLGAALLVYCAVLALYRDFGLPESLARVFQFARMPASRTALGMGLADTVLLVCFLSSPSNREPRPLRAPAVIALGWMLVLSVAALRFHALLPESRPVWLGALVILNGVLAYAICARRFSRAVLGVMVAGLAAGTIASNPLVVGGSDFLTRNPLSQRILEIDGEMGGHSSWLPFGGSDVGNLFRALGVHSLGGLHAIPQLALWQKLDPDGESAAVYNRYAHVGFAPHLADRARFAQRREHGFYVYLNPLGEELTRLGVTHLLAQARPDSRADRFWAQFEPDAQIGHFRIFRLPLRPRKP
jgi:hypothetical protein